MTGLEHSVPEPRNSRSRRGQGPSGALRGLRPAHSGVPDSLGASLQSLSLSPRGHLPASLLCVWVSFLSVSRTFWIQGPP